MSNVAEDMSKSRCREHISLADRIQRDLTRSNVGNRTTITIVVDECDNFSQDQTCCLIYPPVADDTVTFPACSSSPKKRENM